jgi:Ca-activated chloride channel family protein
MEMNMIKFANPDYLYALLLIPVMLLLFLLSNSLSRKALRKFGERSFVTLLMPNYSGTRQWVKFMFFSLAFGFLVIGVSNPQTGSRLEEVKREGIDLFIALDVSKSMLAEDIVPNRLDRSKQAISRLIDKLQGDRIGMIVFAGRAYVQLPITTDYAAARLFLSTINTDIVPVPGTAIGEAIKLAMESFGDSNNSKAIIIISDGEDHEDDPVEAAKLAASQGIHVYTIGMGLAEGTPIPLYNQFGRRTGFHTDKSGNTVITKLDEFTLQMVASAGNGAYTRANNIRSGLEFIYDQISQLDKSEIDSKVYTDYESRFQIFIALALLMLLLELLVAAAKRNWESKISLFERKEEKA